MLPFILFLAAVMVVLTVTGTTVTGMFVLSIVAGVCLALTVFVGAWTLTRRRDHV